MVLVKTLSADDRGCAVDDANPMDDDLRHLWINIVAGPDDMAEVLELTDRYALDRLAVRDALVDVDIPKVDDFGEQILTVLHGLRDDAIGTYEVHCFLTDRALVTIHDRPSQALDAVWDRIAHRDDYGTVPLDLMLAMVADALTRRLIGVLDAFDDRVDELLSRALVADASLLEDLSAVRADLARIRRTVHPQREALDLLRHSTSALMSDVGRRKFSDVFDVATRAAAGLDEARSGLADTLDAYRGAEARSATEVTKVLTVYAAIMLPLSLIAGFFGMNFTHLPWTGDRWGWLAAAGTMALVAAVSMGMFISLGWVRRPSGRRAGEALGRGLIEATKAPVHVVGAVLEMTALPLRATGELLTRPTARDEPDESPDAGNHGSE